MKQYRIGDYAKYLGVTPDLLKHYEELGLLQPERTSKGYRYYSFQTTMLLIESVRLRNYGLTLREISEILNKKQTDNAAIERRFHTNIESLRQEAALDEALARDYENFLEWKRTLTDRDSDWVIRWGRPMYFLPHTIHYDFLEDPRIYEILKDWMSYIPIVKSAMQADMRGKVTWGFIIDQQMHQKLGLPINDVVQAIPSQKIFYYKFRGVLRRMSDEVPVTMQHPAFQILSGMNLTWTDTYYRITLMPADWTDDISMQYGYYAIPLADTQ
ncbi:MAG: MerR family transcriptional regulator [Lachnospiraceae bacterium]|nr:MerR family transcriptional regulator [Lachnospiraceae bacterium]